MEIQKAVFLNNGPFRTESSYKLNCRVVRMRLFSIIFVMEFDYVTCELENLCP